jgi:hypothetical protein
MKDQPSSRLRMKMAAVFGMVQEGPYLGGTALARHGAASWASLPATSGGRGRHLAPP